VALPSYDLVILAAGMGSRFGGIKQVQPIGPHGELIIEYSVFDALRAGYGRLVLVIRKDIEADFRAAIGRRLESRIDVHYVFQETGVFAVKSLASPEAGSSAVRPVWNRAKPWGTAHAVLAAARAVRGPFAAINADDFYGASGYAALAGHFARTAEAPRPAYAMVGYPLGRTLSDHGAVSRGLCATDGSGRLQRISEIAGIEKAVDGGRYTDAYGDAHPLGAREVVSMNFWGLTPGVFPQLERLFSEFLSGNGGDPKAEFYLPTAISALIERQEAEVALLESADAWFGLTYREDLAAARAAVQGLVSAGDYPSPLWG
jgi:hypothetical protein